LAVEFFYMMPGASSTQGQQSTSTDSEFKAENMDHLVKEITENLKLGGALPADFEHHRSPVSDRSSAGFKLKSSFRRGHGVHRSSPYAVPPSSRACDTTLGSSPTSRGPSQLRKWNHQRRRYPSTCMNTNTGASAGSAGGPGSGAGAGPDLEDPEDPFQMLQELIADGSLINEAVRRLQKGLYPEPTPSKTFYDSEDDEGGRTPPNLCCEVGL